MEDSQQVVVAVRTKPLTELEAGGEPCIAIQGNSVSIREPASGADRTFTFDAAYWSVDPADPHFASQQTIYDQLGSVVLAHAWNGFNCSVFAYGQTGSGKTYTMLGDPDVPERAGLIPRVCRSLFARIRAQSGGSGGEPSEWVETLTADGDAYFYNARTRESVWELPEDDAAAPADVPAAAAGGAAETDLYKVVVTYLEIYNERVRDLLREPDDEERAALEGAFSVGGPLPSGAATHKLRVREHPQKGPYVEGLTEHEVGSFEEMSALLARGNELRTTASTLMNETSSRSHAILSVHFTQTHVDCGDQDSPTATDRSSHIALVDLAGSERADKSGAAGQRLREAASINQSLSGLGAVIYALAEQAEKPESSGGGGGGGGRRRRSGGAFIPYRNSVLTWLLKESLGGNAKTIMLATLSAAHMHYAESLSTLRYAERAKRIRTHATVNIDPNLALIQQLRAEIDELRAQLERDGRAGGAPAPPPPVDDELQRQVAGLKIQNFLLLGSLRTRAERLDRARREAEAGAAAAIEAARAEAAAAVAASEEKAAAAAAASAAAASAAGPARAPVQAPPTVHILESPDRHAHGGGQRSSLRRHERDFDDALSFGTASPLSSAAASPERTPRGHPYLLNLHSDPELDQRVVYFLRVGTTTVGREGDIELANVDGLGSGHRGRLDDFHCLFENDGGRAQHVSVITYPGSAVYVNGVEISTGLPPGTPSPLSTGSRVVLGCGDGQTYLFRFVHPQEEMLVRLAEGADAAAAETTAAVLSTDSSAYWAAAQRELERGQPLTADEARGLLAGASPRAVPSPSPCDPLEAYDSSSVVGGIAGGGTLVQDVGICGSVSSGSGEGSGEGEPEPEPDQDPDQDQDPDPDQDEHEHEHEHEHEPDDYPDNDSELSSRRGAGTAALLGGDSEGWLRLEMLHLSKQQQVERDAAEQRMTAQRMLYERRLSELAQAQAAAASDPGGDAAHGGVTEEDYPMEGDDMDMAVAKFYKREHQHFRAARKRWRSAELLRQLRAEVAELQPLIGEANAMAAALARPVGFRLEVFLHRAGTDQDNRKAEASGLDFLSPLSDLRQLQHRPGVRVTNLLSGGRHVWTRATFVRRLARMRDAYRRFLLEGRIEPGGGGDDPFHAAAQHQQLGRAYVDLDALGFCLMVDQCVPVQDNFGARLGLLHVQIMPAPDGEFPLHSGAEFSATLRLVALHGLSRALLGASGTRLFVCYRFFRDERRQWAIPFADVEAARRSGAGATLRLDVSEALSVRATFDFMLYLRTNAVRFELWQESQVEAPSGGDGGLSLQDVLARSSGADDEAAGFNRHLALCGTQRSVSIQHQLSHAAPSPLVEAMDDVSNIEFGAGGGEDAAEDGPLPCEYLLFVSADVEEWSAAKEAFVPAELKVEAVVPAPSSSSSSGTPRARAAMGRRASISLGRVGRRGSTPSMLTTQHVNALARRSSLPTAVDFYNSPPAPPSPGRPRRGSLPVALDSSDTMSDASEASTATSSAGAGGLSESVAFYVQAGAQQAERRLVITVHQVDGLPFSLESVVEVAAGPVASAFVSEPREDALARQRPLRVLSAECSHDKRTLEVVAALDLLPAEAQLFERESGRGERLVVPLRVSVFVSRVVSPVVIRRDVALKVVAGSLRHSLKRRLNRDSSRLHRIGSQYRVLWTSGIKSAELVGELERYRAGLDALAQSVRRERERQQAELQHQLQAGASDGVVERSLSWGGESSGGAVDAGGVLDGDQDDDGDDVEVVPVSAEDQAQKQGYLVKRSKHLKSWGRRWFVLRRPTLYQFKAKTDKRPVDVLVLTESALRVNVEELEIQIETPTENWLLQAASERDLAEWVEALDPSG